jgi:TPR repeat protein
MYEDGEGVTQSCDQARILLTAAAAKGNAQAKLVLKQLQLDEGCAAQ